MARNKSHSNHSVVGDDSTLSGADRTHSDGMMLISQFSTAPVNTYHLHQVPDEPLCGFDGFGSREPQVVMFSSVGMLDAVGQPDVSGTMSSQTLRFSRNNDSDTVQVNAGAASGGIFMQRNDPPAVTAVMSSLSQASMPYPHTQLSYGQTEFPRSSLNSKRMCFDGSAMQSSDEGFQGHHWQTRPTRFAEAASSVALQTTTSASSIVHHPWSWHARKFQVGPQQDLFHKAHTNFNPIERLDDFEMQSFGDLRVASMLPPTGGMNAFHGNNLRPSQPQPSQPQGVNVNSDFPFDIQVDFVSHAKNPRKKNPNPRFLCPVCGKNCKETRARRRHLWLEHREYAEQMKVESEMVSCPVEGCEYRGRKDNAARHLRDVHKQVIVR